VIGNNVLAQVPDINDFVAGAALLLSPTATATWEFPHLLRLVEGLQYDTIYHEHFSYFSLATIERIMSAHGLDVYDVQEIPTHGGSLRVFVCPSGGQARRPAVDALLEAEVSAGLEDVGSYSAFGARVEESKRRLLSLLIDLRDADKSIAAYGAPGKGNTLLNYCGIRSDLIEYTVDRNPYKHGRFLPGTHIPIYDPGRIAETKPDYIVVLPWNLIDEISTQLHYVAEWGGKLIVPIPTAQIRTPGESA
jgi:C-methyltransferase C-terminal domain